MNREEIEAVLDRVRNWPAHRQELAADMLMAIEQLAAGDHELTPELEAELDDAIAEADRGEFVPDAEMKAFFDRHR
ncbi:MAG: hypothetical protein GC166_05910 [Alphaproteobacteria bacterium]|nr:hypothetical protein [Alphaproteobacteria bacterium]